MYTVMYVYTAPTKANFLEHTCTCLHAKSIHVTVKYTHLKLPSTAVGSTIVDGQNRQAQVHACKGGGGGGGVAEVPVTLKFLQQF